MFFLGWLQAPTDLKALTQQAITLHQSGQPAAAIPLYEQILAARPSLTPLRSNLGAAYSATGRFAEAEAQFRQALAASPDPRVQLNLGLALYKQNRIPEAAAEFQQVYSALPANEQVLTLLAECHLMMGDNRQVIALLSNLPLQGQRARQAILGTAFLRDGQLARGQQLLDAILRDGASPEALYLLATAQIAAEDNRAALATLERALQSHPQFPGLHSLYALAKLRDGDPDAGRRAFEQELTINPHDFDANLHLGGLYRLEQNYAAATTHLERARQMRPSSLALRYQLANLALSQRQLDQALAILEPLVVEAPDWVEPHITLATVYYRLKRPADGDRINAIVKQLNAAAQAREKKQP